MNCISLLEWNHDREQIHIQFKADPNTEISKFINAYKSVSSHKKDFVWLKEVDSLALANAQVNMNKVYNNFFRESSLGHPKFKSKKTNRPSYTTNKQKGTIYIEGGYIKLPKIKSLKKIKQTRKFAGLIKSSTISKTASDKFFISILVKMVWEGAYNSPIQLGL